MPVVPACVGPIFSVWFLLVAYVERNATLFACSGGGVAFVGCLALRLVDWDTLKGPVVVREEDVGWRVSGLWVG